MKRLFLAVLGACAFAATASAQFTDQFNTTVSGRWSAPTQSSMGPSFGAANVSGVAFSQDNANSRIDWLLSLAGSGGANRIMFLQTHLGSYDSDWTVELSVNNAFSAADGQSSQVGLMLFNTAGMSDPMTADYLKLVLQKTSPGANDADSIHYGLHANLVTPITGTNYDFDGNGTVLKLVYTASAHTIATYYDNTLITTFGLTSNDSSSLQWGMTSGGTFTLGVYAQSTANSTGYTLSAGTVNIDALTITGFGTAVPEPSTYAALAGLLALGFAAWRRRTG